MFLREASFWGLLFLILPWAFLGTVVIIDIVVTVGIGSAAGIFAIPYAIEQPRTRRQCQQHVQIC